MSVADSSGGHRPPLQEVDWEVLPPEEKRKRQSLEPLFKWLALIMDEIIKNHRLGSTPPRRSDWLFVIGILCALVVIVCAGIAVSFLILGALVQLLFGR